MASAALILADQSINRLAAVAAQCRELGVPADATFVDLCSEKSVRALATTAGRVDILVNSA